MNRRGSMIGEINITPLTDIFLVLLVIMMVVTPLVDFAGLNMAVLSVGPAPVDSKEKPKPLVIDLTAENEFKVGGELVPSTSLADIIRARAAEHPDGVVIDTDPEAAHESLAIALAAANQAGIEKIGVTEKTTPRPDTGPKAVKKPKKDN